MDLDTTLDAASDFPIATYPAPTPAAPRIIKRYANRKFYDSDLSRYVNLEDIAEMIKGGVEVKILENGTMRDLTFVTLGHVISGEAKRRSRLSSRALRDLIRNGDAASDAEEADVREGAPPVHLGACERRLDALLSRGQREGHFVGEMLAGAEASLRRLQARIDRKADSACDVVASFGKLKRELVRLSRRVDDLHERLRDLERPA